jgi:hypothetical protein
MKIEGSGSASGSISQRLQIRIHNKMSRIRNNAFNMWQPGSVGGLILMRPPTAWEERIPRREELYEAARFHTVQIGIVKES